jgi:CIC family chloride channel protein
MATPPIVSQEPRQSLVVSVVSRLRDGWRRACEAETMLVGAAISIGVATAIASAVFHGVIASVHEFFWEDLAGALRVEDLSRYDLFETGLAGLPRYWFAVPVIPVVGMACIVLLDRRFPGEIKGYGMPKFLELVNITGGFLRRRWITLKTISGAITIGSGMSAGIEGPVAQIGGSIGSTVGRALRPSFERLRVLIACGSAAGISASFGSPIAGVMFAQEIVLASEFEARHFYLIILASGAAAVMSSYVSPAHRALHAPAYAFRLEVETLVLYLALGVLAGLLAVAFIRVFYGIRDAFARWPISERLKPLAGGVIVGAALILFPQISGTGYDSMSHAFEGTMSTALLLTLVVMKMLMTSVTLGCGGSGGVFGPSMFIGAMLGGAFAGVANVLSPGIVEQPGTFSLVGMGAFLAAATHAPLTAVFMVWELTQDIGSVVPAMLTSVTGTLVARGILADSIDTHELKRKGLDVHRPRPANILANLNVRGLTSEDFVAIPQSMRLTDFVLHATNSRHTHFPVVNDAHDLVGLVELADFREVLLHREAWPYVVVGETARRHVVSFKTSDSLYDALTTLRARGLDEAPVVDSADPRRLVGMLRRSDIEAFYEKRLLTSASE